MKIAIIYNQDTTGVINTLGIQNKEFYSEETVKSVAGSLEQAGHNVMVLDGNMHIIERLVNFMPRAKSGNQVGMVFNMAYGIQGESRYTHIPSMLEMLGIPYVGSSPSGHALALDKVMTKIIWQSQQLPTPRFWVFSSPNDTMETVTYPVIVKPKMESVSFGLKVVHNEEDLREAVAFIIREFQQQALVEQFIRGREFCVGLLGNNPPETFPVLEIDMNGNPDAIQSFDDKKNTPRQKICPAQLPVEIAGQMQQLSIKAFNALELRDFARVDIRMDEQGLIYLLEINSMASLGETGSYPTAAKVAGYDFRKLVNRMFEVAASRYFALNVRQAAQYPQINNQLLHTRFRTFLRFRQPQIEILLRKLVNTNTHVRNAEGINQCSELIKNELSQLGFSHELFPQLELGNMYYFANTPAPEIDFLLLLTLDDHLAMHEQEIYSESEHRLCGTGIWENKGGIAITIAALQALRSVKLLRKVKMGVFLITDSNIGGKFSREVINTKAGMAKNIISMHGGNSDGSVVTSRSGSASYNLSIKLIDASASENVATVARYFYKTLSAITDITRNEPHNVVAPYQTNFASNIFKVYAHGSTQVSVRFNTMADFISIDKKIRKLMTHPRKMQDLLQTHFDGGLNRPPMPESENNRGLLQRIAAIARTTDISISTEHRWSSSDICNIRYDLPKIDGMGPMGGYDNQRTEFIMRYSLIDRSLLLSMLLAGERVNMNFAEQPTASNLNLT